MVTRRKNVQIIAVLTTVQYYPKFQIESLMITTAATSIQYAPQAALRPDISIRRGLIAGLRAVKRVSIVEVQ